MCEAIIIPHHSALHTNNTTVHYNVANYRRLLPPVNILTSQFTLGIISPQ